ncbi:Trk system potassium uptake protein TrkA [Desulfocucumis palustris]|uniref:Trk system potassium uptake protein TrkA n=1 Tax=Desulfocucumis palustris TaxID=1898651 RepID=A0A2L2XGL3_9FIRM|nr:Trk system potassium transporter TrkA [Desulfocucumis palustris]GBF35335.1 Trk system potassium uptake protein TrkA [Desulfocucumis palustris]
MKITIIGAGKVGLEITRRLSEEGHDIVVIDRDEAKLNKIQEKMDVLTVRGNGSSAQLMRDSGISDSDLLVAVTNSDEINMISCMTAKRLGIQRTIARIRDPDYARDLIISKEDLGVDLVINPEYAASLEIMRLLTINLPVHTELFANGKVQMLELNIDESHSHFAGKKLMEIELPKSCLVVGISRKGNLIVPGGMDFILPGDTIYLLGNTESTNKICSRVKKRKQRVQSVLILGGGKIAYYLTERLCRQGLKVKIIEQNPERCKELSERLPEALILKGDGTDVELLKNEGIHETDGFVAVTGIDEENLLISLLAKQLGAKRVIAKVSRPSYAPLVERLGVDAAISPRLITIGEIMRFIRGGRLLSMVLLLNEQAEAMELIAQTGSKIVGRTLKNSGLPKGVIVGAISRENKIIIPKGNEVIRPEDRLVVFALGHNVHTVIAMCSAEGNLLEQTTYFKDTGTGAVM